MKRIILFCFFPLWVHAQNIVTYAGDGTMGYSGGGVPATDAEIDIPTSTNIDNQGNLLFCQHLLVRKVYYATGIIYTIAGSDTATSAGHGGDGGPATCALTVNPYDICTDKAGNFYVADAWYGEIRKVDIATGIIDTFAGNRSSSGISGDGGPAKSAGLASCGNLCFDTGQNYLYISVANAHKIRRVDMNNDTIGSFAGTGTLGFAGDNGPAISAQFGRVLSLRMDAANNLYIGDWDNHRIRRVDGVTGIVTTIAGTGTAGYYGDGIAATDAQLQKPTGICFDKCGNLYFSDEDNNRVRRIDRATGIINTIAGNGTAGFGGDSGPALNAEFNHPTGVVIDSQGHLYIGDYYNNRVRRLDTFASPFVSIAAATDTLCPGYPITLQANTAIAGSSPTFQWSVNGVIMSGTASSYTYVPANGDSVSCILTSSSGCVGTATVQSNTVHIVVNSASISPSVSIAGVTAAATGALVTVTATVVNAGSSYSIKWYNNGALFNTTSVPVVSYIKAPGTDHITATLLPALTGIPPSCYDSAVTTVLTIVDTSSTSISLMPGSISGLWLYPNPVDDVLHIYTKGSIQEQYTTYCIRNVTSATLLQGRLHEGDNSIILQQLPSGVYIIVLQGPTAGLRVIRKIVKQ